MRAVFFAAALAVGMGMGVVGCGPSSDHKTPGASPPTSAAPAGSGPAANAKPAAAVSDADLSAVKVNEAGLIPILEYHNIVDKKGPYFRSPQNLRKDLDTLYAEGYRPIALHELLDNKIDVPLGKTPVVLTFDDSSPTQFKYLDNGTIDPDCAYGILKAFHEAHPDFAMKGIFFINASAAEKGPVVFGQRDSSQKKVKELLAAGMETGNHTVNHLHLNLLTDQRVQQELADCEAGIHALAPEAVVDTLALPFGLSPANKKLAETGEYGGVTYHNRAVLLVGSEPAPGPCTVKFNPLRLRRVQACPGDGGIDYWLKILRDSPRRRYISDGDPATVTVPASAKSKIDTEKLGAAKLRTY